MSIYRTPRIKMDNLNFENFLDYHYLKIFHLLAHRDHILKGLNNLLQNKIEMIYFISGASRSGKTTLAKKLSIHKGIPYLSVDWIMMGFTEGIPEFGIHDKLMPDVIAKRLWSFIKAMVENMLYFEQDCIIEGEALLPELICQLIEKHPDDIKSCFIGYSHPDIEKKLKEIRRFGSEKIDWLNDKSDDYVRDHTYNMIAHSKLIKKSCEQTKLPYFDVSKSFVDVIEDVETYLLTNRIK